MALTDPLDRKDIYRIALEIPGDPHGQPRAGVRTTGRRKPSFYARSQVVEHWRATIREGYQQRGGQHLGKGAVRVRLCFFFPRPISLMSKNSWPGPIPYLKKPDSDNVAKAVLDALKEIAWRDDCQVYDLHIQKWYVAWEQDPTSFIEIVGDVGRQENPQEEG